MRSTQQSWEHSYVALQALQMWPVESVIKAHVTVLLETTEAQEEFITSYSAMVYYLFRQYATDDNIAKVNTDIPIFKEQDTTATNFDKKFWRKTFWCGLVHTRKMLKNIFVEGFRKWMLRESDIGGLSISRLIGKPSERRGVIYGPRGNKAIPFNRLDSERIGSRQEQRTSTRCQPPSRRAMILKQQLPLRSADRQLNCSNSTNQYETRTAMSMSNLVAVVE